MSEKSDGYLVSKETLRQYDEVTDRVLGDGGQGPNQINGLEKYLRKPKFVKTPSGGITTTDPTQPGSATCKVMEWNGDWSQLTENTDIEETVYSLVSIAGDTIVEVKPVAGRLFAATGIGNPADASNILLSTQHTFNSSDSGWNLIDDFYFENPSNPIGNDTSGTDYAWSSVFDSRPSNYPTSTSPGGLQIEKAGIYYGVIPFDISIVLGSGVEITVGDVSTVFSEPDTGNNVWQAASTSFTDIQRIDGMAFSINLYLTGQGNTTAPSSVVAIGSARYETKQDISYGINGTNIRLQIDVPFYVYVESDDAPAEIQPWINIDTAHSDAWSYSSNITFEDFNSVDHEDQRIGWIRYIPDTAQFADDQTVTAPP